MPCSDGTIGLNPATDTGPSLDTTAVDYPSDPTTRHRERINVAGCEIDEVAEVTDACPAVDAMGLVTRPVGCGPNGEILVSIADQTIDVNVTTTDTGFSDPGVPGTIVAGSEWHRTGFVQITLTGGNLILQSPVPSGTQHVVISWWDWVATLTANLGAFSASNPVIREVATPANLHWQYSFGFVSTAKAGNEAAFETSRHILTGPVGAQLELVIPVTPLVDIDLAANMGGYLTETA